MSKRKGLEPRAWERVEQDDSGKDVVRAIPQDERTPEMTAAFTDHMTNKRLNGAVSKIKLLGNHANSNYDLTPRQREFVVETLLSAVQSLNERYVAPEPIAEPAIDVASVR